jgi:hypothetical protein
MQVEPLVAEVRGDGPVKYVAAQVDTQGRIRVVPTPDFDVKHAGWWRLGFRPSRLMARHTESDDGRTILSLLASGSGCFALGEIVGDHAGEKGSWYFYGWISSISARTAPDLAWAFHFADQRGSLITEEVRIWDVLVRRIKETDPLSCLDIKWSKWATDAAGLFDLEIDGAGKCVNLGEMGYLVKLWNASSQLVRISRMHDYRYSVSLLLENCAPLLIVKKLEGRSILDNEEC